MKIIPTALQDLKSNAISASLKNPGLAKLEEALNDLKQLVSILLITTNNQHQQLTDPYGNREKRHLFLFFLFSPGLIF